MFQLGISAAGAGLSAAGAAHARFGRMYTPGANRAANVMLYPTERAKQWSHFTGALLERILDQGSDRVAVEIDDLNWDPTQHGLVKELDKTADLPPEEARETQRSLARVCSLGDMPAEVFYMVLDRLCGFNADRTSRLGEPEQITVSTIQHLRTMEELDQSTKEMIAAWMSSTGVQSVFDQYTSSYKDYWAARYDYSGWATKVGITGVIHATSHGFGPTLLALNNVPTQLTNCSLAYECIRDSTESFDFLLRHKIIDIEGYDAIGLSWAKVAIELKREDVFNYIVQKLPLDECFSTGFVGQFPDNNRDRRYIFSSLCELGWHWAIEYLFDRVLAADEDPLTFFSEELRYSLCSSATVELANCLVNVGINITQSTEEGRARPPTGPVLYYPKDAWQSAITNSNGEEFFNWFRKHSRTRAQDYRDVHGRNLLILAIDAARPLAVKWLIKKNFGLNDTVPQDPTGIINVLPPWAGCLAPLYYAIRADTLHGSRAMQTFRIVLQATPSAWLEDPANTSLAFDIICAQYAMNAGSANSEINNKRAYSSMAVQMTQGLMGRIPESKWQDTEHQRQSIVTADNNSASFLVKVLANGPFAEEE